MWVKFNYIMMKYRKNLLAIVLSMMGLCCLGSERNTVKLDSRLLHGGEQVWQMMHSGDNQDTGRQISMLGYQTDSLWTEAVVPGTVLTNLVLQKVFPEPYYGQNNYLRNNIIPDLSQIGREFYTYWFRTEFTVPAEFEGRRVWIEPEGVNYRAEIWLNGFMLGMMSGMFNSQPYEITDKVKPGEKAALAIRVYPVDIPGTSRPKDWGVPGEWHNGGDGWIGQNVTQLMTVGWDFTFKDGIRDRNTGIWRSIHLYSTGNVQLRHPMVVSELSHPNYDQSSETITVDVYNPNFVGAECTVRAKIEEEGIELEKKVKLMRGEHQTVTFDAQEYPQLKLQNPRLWWPKNKGEQNLYSLTLTARNDKGELIDSIQTRFGIREVVASRETPDKSKMFIVNGHKMFIRGSNWIPEAMLRTDDARMRTELAYTDQSGINLLRLWGGGIVESDLFYDLCDQYGIMVWQEFFMTGDTRHPLDEALYLANVESAIKRIRNHPSIIFYVSSNESTAVTGAEELIHKLDPTRPYQMQSECDGIHDGSPYKHVNPMRHYENSASERGSRVDGFNPEYGAPTMPIAQSLRQMMPKEDLWPMNKETWDYLDGSGFHCMTTLYTDQVNEYGESSSLEEFARKGQMVGAINSKSIWEVWNENTLEYGDRWCSGLLFWYHNSPNVQVCARMWDWYLEPTASLYHTMHAMEPIHAQFDYLTNTVSVINDYLQEQKNLRINAQLYDMNSRRLLSYANQFDVPADGVASNVLTLQFPDNITPVHFIALQVYDAQGKLLSRNFYWRSNAKYEGSKTMTGPCTSGFQTLKDMPQAKPLVQVTSLPDEDNMHCWKVLLKNNGHRIAFFCQLLLTDEEGNAIHRTHYSDNFFSMVPGEQQTILIKTPCTETSNYQLQFTESLGPVRLFHMK